MMEQSTEKLIEIIEDHKSMENGLRMILEALETKVLPPYGILPVFNDSVMDEMFTTCLELAAGKEYEK